MKKCKQCGSNILNRTIINGQLKQTSNRHYCLICSPFKLRSKNPRALSLLERFCPKCKKTKQTIKFGIRKRSNGTSTTSSWCKECILSESTERQKLFKEICIAYKGGRCIRCHYDRCFAALEFHHRDPSRKEFQLSKSRNHRWSVRLKNELDKCDLVCANCHREVHADYKLYPRSTMDVHPATNRQVESSSLSGGAGE